MSRRDALATLTELARLSSPLDNPGMDANQPKPRRWFRFSLRTMFVLVTVAAVLVTSALSLDQLGCYLREVQIRLSRPTCVNANRNFDKAVWHHRDHP